MGKKEKGWDWPDGQRISLVLLGLSFLLGGGGGCLLAALAGGEGAQELSAYLCDYLTAVQKSELPLELFVTVWEQLKVLLAALLLGLTALGVLGLPLLFGIRGFFFSFSAACFCRVFGARGALPAFVLFALPALLWAPALFIVGVQSLRSARQLLGRALGGGKGGTLFGSAYWCRAGLCVGLTLAGSLLEYWVVPVLLREAAKAVL